MLVKAYAKINLSLDVVGKKADGYHLLKMIMQSIELYDTIELKKIHSGIRVICDKEYVPTDERNLAYKAAELFKKTYGLQGGVEIIINKLIPVSAGLAGGSTDAAAVLKAMRNLFKPELKNQQLMDIGLRIGADVPYCIVGGTALCQGIGEEITPLNNFSNHILVLVKPNFGVSTKEVYERIDVDKIYKHPETEKLMAAVNKNNLYYVAKNMRNVLENVTLKKHSILKDIKDEMISQGALGALMSGSGPSVFGMFDDMLKAQQCFEKMKTKYRETFITRTI